MRYPLHRKKMKCRTSGPRLATCNPNIILLPVQFPTLPKKYFAVLPETITKATNFVQVVLDFPNASKYHNEVLLAKKTSNTSGSIPDPGQKVLRRLTKFIERSTNFVEVVLDLHVASKYHNEEYFFQIRTAAVYRCKLPAMANGVIFHSKYDFEAKFVSCKSANFGHLSRCAGKTRV